MTDATELKSRPELLVAAKWWANLLRRHPNHDNGDASQSSFANAVTTTVCRPLTEEQVIRFQDALVEECANAYAGHTWNEESPHYASALRALVTDYGPGFLLNNALDKAGIDHGNLRLPYKTVMWVNPGSVMVRPGYGAMELPLYKGNPDERSVT